jgi:hypothetical protein
MYQIIEEAKIIRHNENGTVRWIPFDESNADYQNYLEWVAAGNEPEIINMD